MSRLLLVAASLLAAPAAGTALPMPVPAPPEVPASGYLVVAHSSGQVIAQHNADARLEPASITKLMTAYIAFNEIANDNLDLDDAVTISEKAWRTPGSRMFVEVGKRVTVGELLQGMIIQSGNDASVALAEHIAGSEDAFANLMNQYASRLGLRDTHYANSTGLPAEEHYSTARDIAVLAMALVRDFPEHYRWYSVREFTFNGITQHNRNALLWRDDSVDGVKTGHTDAAGYCLVASALRDGMRLVSVVLGTPSEKARADASQALLNYGFRFFETHRLYAAGDTITTSKVWKGTAEQAALGVQDDLYVTIPRGRYDDLAAVMDVRAVMVAPLETSEPLGTVRVSLDDELLASAPLFALQSVSEGSLWRRVIDGIRLWFE